MDYDNQEQSYDDEVRNYRDRTNSPRPEGHANGDSRARSASPNGRDRDMRGPPPPPPPAPPEEDEEAARNTGTNLFVTGISPRMSEEDVARMFEKYGQVAKCNIMRDPHTKESRGFGFVNMYSAEEADAAKEGLQGEVYEGRTLSIEKARRSKPRTPTPGRYFGPPKRDDFRGPPRGRFGDRHDDRRGAYGRRDDRQSYRGSRFGDRYSDRTSDRHSDRHGSDRYADRHEDRSYSRRDRYDDRSSTERYANRDERYGGSSSSRRGGASGSGGDEFYDRGAAQGRSADPYAEQPVGSGRSYDDRADDRYSRR